MNANTLFDLALVPLQGEEPIEIDPTILLGVMVVLLAIAVGVGYWVYKDASKRENNELAWSVGIGALLFLSLLFGIIALIAYVIVRGDEVDGEPSINEPTGEW